MQVLIQFGCLVLIPISEVLPDLEESIVGFIGCKSSVVRSSFFAAEMVSLVFWREKHTLQFLSKSTSGFLYKILICGHLESKNYIFWRGFLNSELESSKTHFVLKKIMLLNLFFSVTFFLVFFFYLLHLRSVCLGCQHRGWFFSLLLYSKLHTFIYSMDRNCCDLSLGGWWTQQYVLNQLIS